MITKPLKEEDALKIIPLIKNLNAHTIWHDHTDETIGNLDLGGEKINIRKNASALILSIVRTGELLGIDLAPTESMTISEYFERSHKRIRDSIGS